MLFSVFSLFCSRVRIFPYPFFCLFLFLSYPPPPEQKKVRGRFQLSGPAGSDGAVRYLSQPVRPPDGSAGAALGHGRASRGPQIEARAAGGMMR